MTREGLRLHWIIIVSLVDFIQNGDRQPDFHLLSLKLKLPLKINGWNV